MLKRSPLCCGTKGNRPIYEAASYNASRWPIKSSVCRCPTNLGVSKKERGRRSKLRPPNQRFAAAGIRGVRGGASGDSTKNAAEEPRFRASAMTSSKIVPTTQSEANALGRLAVARGTMFGALSGSVKVILQMRPVAAKFTSMVPPNCSSAFANNRVPKP
jgi:hypothetical protein